MFARSPATKQVPHTHFPAFLFFLLAFHAPGVFTTVTFFLIICVFYVTNYSVCCPTECTPAAEDRLLAITLKNNEEGFRKRRLELSRSPEVQSTDKIRVFNARVNLSQLL